MTHHWVTLFSGGKDSSWALYQALEEGLPVEELLTVHPDGDSYLYHVPATELASLAAESIGLELVHVRPDSFETNTVDDVAAQGDAELEPLEATLEQLDGDHGQLAGVIVGAVESEFQHSRVSEMADRLDIDVYAPLWQRNPSGVAKEMIQSGFEIRMIRVAAAGLDESWLGRTLDSAAITELEALSEQYGLHVLGEGGEFETLVTDGPHMDRPIKLNYETQWDGTRGHVEIRDAWLGETDG